MPDSKDDTGKGPSRPGDLPGGRRPYATIDAKATEVESRDRPAGAAGSRASASATADAKSDAKPQAKAAPPRPTGPTIGARIGSALASLRQGSASLPLLTNVAAGAAGAAIALVATYLFLPDRAPARAPEVSELTRRVSDLEGSLGTRPNTGLRARVEEVNRSLGALGESQARLARDTKALEGKVGSVQELPPEVGSRIAKLEESLGALTGANQEGQPPQLAALALRLTQIEKSAREASEAVRTGIARFEGDLSAIRTEAGRLAQRLDGLKGELDERLKTTAKAADVGPLSAKLAALEQDLQAFRSSESDRTANTSRVVLSLELANLKRAVDRGDAYADELAQVKTVAGRSIDLSALERSMREGVPTVAELTKSFRKVANAMLDAEEQTADAGVVDRLLSGARSIVRVRKAGHAADDTSAEAVIGRMETALKDGRLGDVLASAKKLPPKAELAGEDWVRKVTARHAVDKALADVETALKTSLGAGPHASAPDAKR